MEIITRKIEELKPYENNPRINNQAVWAVANSISSFGFKVPLIIDKDDVIVCGHTRYKAAMQLGMDEVPCIVADDLNEEQIKAFRLADNKVSELADWDFDLLSVELDELAELNFDMGDFGFEDISAEVGSEEEAEAPDDFKEYGEDIATEHKCPMCGYEW